MSPVGSSLTRWRDDISESAGVLGWAVNDVGQVHTLLGRQQRSKRHRASDARSVEGSREPDRGCLANLTPRTSIQVGNTPGGLAKAPGCANSGYTSTIAARCRFSPPSLSKSEPNELRRHCHTCRPVHDPHGIRSN